MADLKKYPPITRHWVPWQKLQPSYGVAYGLSDAASFKAAFTANELKDKCQAIEHDKRMYLPGRACDYALRDALSMVSYLKRGGNSTPTRLTLLEHCDRAIFNQEKQDSRSAVEKARGVFHTRILDKLDCTYALPLGHPNPSPHPHPQAHPHIQAHPHDVTHTHTNTHTVNSETAASYSESDSANTHPHTHREFGDGSVVLGIGLRQRGLVELSEGLVRNRVPGMGQG